MNLVPSTSSNAIVTGAGSGIGRGVALALAGRGMAVALVGRGRDKLDETARLVAEAHPGARTLVLPCDITDRPAVEAMAEEAASALGPIDVLVCNAGTNVRERSLEKLSYDDWDKMIATNLTGAFNLVHAILPGMRASKSGLIVQVCSISGKRASVLGGAGYSASKFGQAALGITLGREEAARGIRSSVIYPGEVNTPILDARPVPVPEDRRRAILQPEDVAAAVAFLVDLDPRANVPELVIKPTVDDWA
jgi:NAD(P)-dependent dehydrogenase (short-subunit alcohol dehydrogenase family)